MPETHSQPANLQPQPVTQPLLATPLPLASRQRRLVAAPLWPLARLASEHW